MKHRGASALISAQCGWHRSGVSRQQELEWRALQEQARAGTMYSSTVVEGWCNAIGAGIDTPKAGIQFSTTGHRRGELEGTCPITGADVDPEDDEAMYAATGAFVENLQTMPQCTQPQAGECDGTRKTMEQFR